jgi:hypothetical protein
VRWAVWLLLLANLALAGYLLFIDRGPAPVADVRVRELNADKVKILKASGGAPRTACLEWSNLGEDGLSRAREALADLGPGKIAVQAQALFIADPSPALVGRVTELKAGFAGSELKAVACPAGVF